SSHLVTDGSFVLCEGELLDGIFQVCALHALAAIPRKVSIEKDQLPVEVLTASMSAEQLKILEAQEESREGSYVILSEVHLDSVPVLEMLETLFQGYESHGPPTAYIFMGSFCSRSFVPTGQGVRAYREGFERLKFMMRNLEAHVMHGTRFVFIPGPRDPGPQTLPKAPLPDYLTANLAVDIPGAVGKPKRWTGTADPVT
ncbi:DNA polymerase epsilon subunit B (DNA polymerase II subunit 2) (AtDPB2) (Protein CYCLOPS 2), partial [Durusdinium trenchii]